MTDDTTGQTEAPETTDDETQAQTEAASVEVETVTDSTGPEPTVDDADDVDDVDIDADSVPEADVEDEAAEATDDMQDGPALGDTDDDDATDDVDVDVHAPTGPIAVPDESGELKPLAPIRLVEAALFTAGRPVAIDELMEATGLGKRDVGRAVKSLAMEYADLEDKTALEVAMAGDKWAMQLKTKYVEHAQKLANMEIPKKVLKTLALVAFHQPLLQSDLVDMVGSKTYDHVRELHECGLIKLKKEGLSKRIVTSTAFPEYFGIPATDTEQIRTYLAEKVGLQLRARTGEAPLSQYDGPQATAAETTAEEVPEGTAAAPEDAESEASAPVEEPGQAEDADETEETEESETVTTDTEEPASEATEEEAAEEVADEDDPRLADVDLVASESTA